MKQFFLQTLLFAFFSLTALAQYQIPVYSANSDQPGQPGWELANAIDGYDTTGYHSKWSYNAMPEQLTFYFVDAPSINKITYLPRTDAGNGTWTKIELSYSMVSNPTVFVPIQDYTFLRNSDLKTIDLANGGMATPYAIRIKVVEAVGNFSAAREIRFFSATQPQNSVLCAVDGNSASNIPDRKNAIVSAVASNTQGAAVIERTYDGDNRSFYHSTYPVTPLPDTPIDLDYTLAANSVVDYIVYTPRLDGGMNGNFGNIKVYYKPTASSSFIELQSYNMAFTNSALKILLPQRLVNPHEIRIRVVSGYGNFASCSEMDFIEKTTPSARLYTNVFEDEYYNKLKSGITQNDIDTISNAFYKSLASCLFSGAYDLRYRFQKYLSYPNVATTASLLKTSTYNHNENPTGIYFKPGDKAVLFVGPEANDFSVSLKVSDLRDNNVSNVSSYLLKSGINILNITTEGLGYINYFTDDTLAHDIKINIATGLVNGCFDPLIDDEQQWVRILTNNIYQQIDLKGKNVNLVLNRSMLKAFSPFEGTEFVQTWDRLVRVQYDLMGLPKYNKVPKNHMFAWANGSGGLYASGQGAHFDYGWGAANYSSASGLLNGDVWGVAHEFGHVNQVRPGFKWIGTADVTNNLYSIYTDYTMGPNKYKNARLEREPGPAREGEAYFAGGNINSFLDKLIRNQNNIANTGLFQQLVPLWQLSLYYQFAGSLKGLPTLEERISGTAAAPTTGPDPAYWSGDMMEVLRNTDETGLSNGELVLNFVKNMCDAVGEDLTDFFTKTGYLRPISKIVNDYVSDSYVITQAQIDATIAAVKAKNYPLPVSPVMYYMSANSLNAFKNKLLAEGTTGIGVTLNEAQQLLVVDHNEWKNVVAFETYDATDSLLRINIVGSRDVNNNTTTIEYPSNAKNVYSVSYDGSKKLVYPFVKLPVTLVEFSAKNSSEGAEIKWRTTSEVDCDKFLVEKSLDGRKFKTIAEVKSTGGKEFGETYLHVDSEFKVSAYYRLTQLDNDSKSNSYNNIVRYVKGVSDSESLILFPNPGKNFVSFKYPIGYTEVSGLKVFDIRGVAVPVKYSNQSGVIQVDINKLDKGVYNLQFWANDQLVNRKLIKN